MANLPLILQVAAFLLTLIAAFVNRPNPTPYPWLPHFGWLGLSIWFLSGLLR